MALILNKKGIAILAKKISEKVKGGEVFLLEGNLGVGKTFLVKEIGKNLKAKNIKSPSFVILDVHRTRKKFFLAHFDFYRLSLRDIKNFEWQEFIFNKNYLCFIEWGEKIRPLLKNKDFFKIKFKWVSPQKREIILSSNLEKWLEK